MTRQPPLPLRHAQIYRAEAFLRTPAHDEIFTWLDRPASWPGLRLAIWGAPGLGKTHLLRMWADHHQAALIDARALADLPTLPDAAALAIDEAGPTDDARAHDETALLHLLNAAGEAGRPLLLASREPPARWNVALPDLASRLRATLAVGLPEPDDAFLASLLLRLLAERRLAVSERLQGWLLRRLPRTASALREAVAALDEESYACRAAVNRDMAARVVARVGGDAADGLEEFSQATPFGASQPGERLL